jgi:SAM-dependent methyltransferase
MDETLREQALERWKNCYPNGYLTWGKMLSGDSYIELAKKYDIFSSRKNVLELGPGYGRLFSSMLVKDVKFNHYTGIDISENNINMLREHFRFENVDFIHGDISKVQLEKKYDVVISSLVLKHQFPTFFNSLKNISNFVNDEGVFFFDLFENKNSGKNDLNDILENGPAETNWHQSKSRKIMSPWETGNDTYVGFYSRNEVSLILGSIPLRSISFDTIIHDQEKGERLVILARK